MRTTPAILFALAVLLAACAPVGTRELSEVVLASSDGARKIRYVYGSSDTMVLNGRERRLGSAVGEAAENVAYAVPSARRVAGDPYLMTSLDRSFTPPIEAARIPLSSDLRVRTNAPVARALYFDGSRWFTLGRDLPGNRTVTVAPAPKSGRLRGVGSLTPAEADAIASALEAPGGPVLLAVLPEGASADALGSEVFAPRPDDGLDEYRHTALWIQRTVPVDASAYSPPSDERIFDVVARGQQGEDPDEDRFVLLPDRDALRAFWNDVHASSFTPPPVPDVRFGRETLIGIRLSQRPSGGYGIEIEGVTRDDGDVYVDVRLTEPGPDEVATTALTTPWVLVRVLGVDARVVWFRDADTGELIAVAREGGSDVF